MSSKDIYNQLQDMFSQTKDPYNKYGVDWITVDEQLEKIFYVSGQVIALLATLIAILFTITVCIELAYITIPLLRDNIEGFGSRHEKAEGVYKIAIGDARKAVMIANTVKTGRQQMQVYLGLKIKQFIIVALQLWVAQNIDLFINLVLRFVAPIIDTISYAIHG